MMHSREPLPHRAAAAAVRQRANLEERVQRRRGLAAVRMTSPGGILVFAAVVLRLAPVDSADAQTGMLARAVVSNHTLPLDSRMSSRIIAPRARQSRPATITALRPEHAEPSQATGLHIGHAVPGGGRPVLRGGGETDEAGGGGVQVGGGTGGGRGSGGADELAGHDNTGSLSVTASAPDSDGETVVGISSPVCQAKPGYYCLELANHTFPHGIVCPTGFWCAGGDKQAEECGPGMQTDGEGNSSCSTMMNMTPELTAFVATAGLGILCTVLCIVLSSTSLGRLNNHRNRRRWLRSVAVVLFIVALVLVVYAAILSAHPLLIPVHSFCICTCHQFF